MNPVQRILCATDLSPESDEAIRYALTLAHAFGAQVYICHTLEAAALTEDVQGMIQRILEEAARDCLPESGPIPEYEIIVTTGEAVRVITHEAAQRRADLIVMRSRRRSYAATLLGSNAEAVCHNAPCPVLVIHTDEEPREKEVSTAMPLQRILMAHDFSIDSEAALLFATALARRFQAALHLLHVRPARPADGGRDTEQAESLAAQDCEELRQAIPPRVRNGCEIHYAVREGAPWRAILDYADEYEVDLICMGLRGMGQAEAGGTGSNADQVLRQAPCPTLVARPPKSASFSLAESRMEAEA